MLRHEQYWATDASSRAMLCHRCYVISNPVAPMLRHEQSYITDATSSAMLCQRCYVMDNTAPMPCRRQCSATDATWAVLHNTARAGNGLTAFTGTSKLRQHQTVHNMLITKRIVDNCECSRVKIACGATRRRVINTTVRHHSAAYCVMFAADLIAYIVFNLASKDAFL